MEEGEEETIKRPFTRWKKGRGERVTCNGEVDKAMSLG